ncbi:Plancitoxin-1 [Trichinella murrelli]|uniref:Plancitoxin-1 n=1 Tax=Trichinella murrelli TaxID=144512 RepID=A0A0V0T769_9BILA|nr:Plancitoxin-1 [Trichinella murrelli]
MKEVTLLTLLIFCIFHFCIAQTSKCQRADGGVAAAPAWDAYPQDLDNNAGDHSFKKALESVTGTHQNKHFFAYNNAAAGVVGVKTKSNSVIILDTTDAADAAAWIVHTVPGYPIPKATYTFPASEYKNGHLLICLTIAESQIEPIAAALFMASPFIHYNDVPEAEVKTRPTLRKLLNGETAVMPPFATKQNIGTQAVPSVPVQIFSKSGRSKYEIYQKVISKQLKKTIKVWSRRDKKLKANCKIPGRHILLVSSPISVDNQASSLEKDVTNWLIPENGDVFCAVDKPYAISQKVVLYKPPGEKRGKILVPPGDAWADNPQDLQNAAAHSFAKALESVVQNHNDKKFFAYNNAASGVVILDIRAGTDEAAWIVHTVPGYPIPKVQYTFPASEYANGHLLICLTISESQIEPIVSRTSLKG